MPTVRVNDVDLAYELVGDDEPLVLLNGVMMTMASWGLQTRTLSRHYRCVLHDFRGQLKSGKPPGPYGLRVHADDLAALLDHLSLDRVHLAGTSYGGEVAMEFALAYPERVRSLVVIASVSEVHEELKQRIERWIAIAETDRESLYDATVADNFSAAFLEEHPEFIEAGRERLRGFDDDWFRALADLCRAFEELSLTPRLRAITAPTLVIAGERDVLKPPAYSEIIAREIAGAKLDVIPGAGHAIVIEQPAAVNDRILGFLREVDTAHAG